MKMISDSITFLSPIDGDVLFSVADDEAKANLTGRAFMYLLIHEQYFYPFYEAYQPNYKDKLFAAVQWAHDNGYRPTFIKDIAFEKIM